MHFVCLMSAFLAQYLLSHTANVHSHATVGSALPSSLTSQSPLSPISFFITPPPSLYYQYLPPTLYSPCLPPAPHPYPLVLSTRLSSYSLPYPFPSPSSQFAPTSRPLCYGLVQSAPGMWCCKAGELNIGGARLNFNFCFFRTRARSAFPPAESGQVRYGDIRRSSASPRPPCDGIPPASV